MKSENKRIFDEAMTELLVNNVNALFRGKLDIKILRSMNDEELLKLIKGYSKENANKFNDAVNANKILKKKLNSLGKKRFLVYILILVSQSVALILNQIYYFLE